MNKKTPILDGAIERMTPERTMPVESRGEAGTQTRAWLAGNGKRTVRHINHEEYEYAGSLWVCHWESKSERYGVSEAGWVCYVKDKTDSLTASPAVDAVKPLAASLDEGAPHTPGPWRDEGGIIVANSGDEVAELLAHNSTVPAPQLRANRKLVSAAPEMIAALKSIVAESQFDEDGDSITRGDSLIAIARLASAAIARAEGAPH